MSGGDPAVSHLVEVAPAAPAEQPIIEALAELYVYDFTEFTGEHVDHDGRFRPRWVEQYWLADDRHPFLFRVDGELAGFALVHSGAPHDMAEFFVLRKFRGRGVAAVAALDVFARFPGEWQVRQLDANTRAIAFWRRAIPGPYTEDRNEKGPVQHFVSSAGP